MSVTAAVIGTGRNPEEPSAEGFAMGHHHADGFERAENAELVACADVVRENAEAFATKYGLDDANVFIEYEKLLASVDPDVVSVTVPPALHADIVIDCIRAGTPAIHCEKPMALTWGECRRMAQEAHRHDCRLTFNHQRRFAAPVREAKRLLDAGEIGDPKRFEMGGDTLYDYGTHSFDICNYFNDETPPTWVLGQVDYREESIMFGTHNENHAVVQWGYPNGVTGLAATGYGQATIGAHNRIVGTDGVIEVGPSDADAVLRVRRDGADWEPIEANGEGLHDWAYVHRAIGDVVNALEAGTHSELRARNALDATELIFGAWESARRRARVEFPLTIEDNPLEAMVDSGALTPAPPAE